MLSGLKDVLAFWRPRKPSVPFAVLFKKFKSVLERNNRILELMADMGDKLGGEYVFDRQYILAACESLADLVFKLVSDLSVLSQRKNVELFIAFERIQHQIQEELAGRHPLPPTSLTLPLRELTHDRTEEAGNKLAILGDVRNILGLPTPEGFVITTKAFFDFLEHAGARRKIEPVLAAWNARDAAAFERLAEEVRARILASDVPRALASAIAVQVGALAAKAAEGPPRFAVRSSAWGEDSEFSFAGQYESVLGVPPEGVVAAYRRVVASAYAPAAWQYRLHRGYREDEMAMAVGCQLMVEGVASGGLYTYAPLSLEGEPMVVSGAWGLGAPVVDGTVETDTFVLDRIPPHALRTLERGSKTRRLVVCPGGTAWEEVPEELRDRPCLTSEQLGQLAQAAMVIERFYRRPQDVEWTFDRSGGLYILQTRPLNVRPREEMARPGIDAAALGHRTLFAGKGTVVQQGVAAGRVHVVRDDNDLRDFPYGSILVTRYTSPRFARLMPRARGIITDVGSPTGHMATIAREHRVPTLVNTGVATRLLRTGDEITLDATQNAVYRGFVAELCRFELTEEDVFEESYEYRLLRRILKKVTPLNLVDPHSDGFRPANCRTYHDITRYIHEKAVEELIRLSEEHHRHHDTKPRRLVTDMPLGLTVIDVDGGLREGTGEEPTASDVVSAPMRALLDGMAGSDMWATEPVSVDLGSFMSSFTRTFSSSLADPRQVGRNLAVISREYMNLHLRLGYHFNIIDAYIGETVNDNAIYFRFLGGVTDFIRRSRRARFIAEVLERFDFRIEVRGDLVVGRVKKVSKRRMAEKMRILGGLVGYTRQLDVLMCDENDVGRRVEDFMTRIASVLEEPHEHTD